MVELHRRRAFGKKFRLLGDIIVLENNSVNNRSQISTSLLNTSSTNLVSSPSLPLRVNLPSLFNSTSLCQPHLLSVTALLFLPSTDNVNK